MEVMMLGQISGDLPQRAMLILIQASKDRLNVVP